MELSIMLRMLRPNKGQRKNFVIDTSVLAHHKEAVHSFDGHNLYIPIEVLEELDNLKVRMDNVGASCRYVNRFLDGLRAQGNLFQGVKLPNDQMIYVTTISDMVELPSGMADTIDNRIISVAKVLSKSKGETIVVSRDISLRVRCDSLDILATDFEQVKRIEKDNDNDDFTGITVVNVTQQEIDHFYREDILTIDGQDFSSNEGVVLKCGQASALAMAEDSNTIRKMNYARGKSFNVQGISPRSKEQYFAMEMLLDPNIHMVSLSGMAGCGKTFLTVAAALHHLEKNNYEKLIISRPVQSTSKDIGFLPGPQPLDAKILTPSGWTTMGEVDKGDYVISKDGSKTKVLDIFPKGKKNVYEIITSDGRRTESCIDHLWFTKTLRDKKNNHRGSVKTTEQIMNSLRDPKFKNRLNHFLPRVAPVVYDSALMPIPAYSLGALLGDGSICSSINLTSIDNDIIERFTIEMKLMGCTVSKIKNSIQYNVSSNQYSNKLGKEVIIADLNSGETKIYPSVGIASEILDINKSTLNSRCEENSTINNIEYKFGIKDGRWSNLLKRKLGDLGLIGKKSNNKFIPEKYLYSSVEDRIALLRGLMDMDGSVRASTGEATYYTVSKQLANDVISLVQSLGGNASYHTRKARSNTLPGGRRIVGKHDSYVVSVSILGINPFYLDRKASLYKKNRLKGIKIKSINLIGKKEVQCILVDNKEHLYVTDDFIVTHNTKEEKMTPWLQPIFDNFDVLTGKMGRNYLKMMMEKGVIEVEALTYVRGRTLPNTIFIIDEAQNITHHEAKALLTRMGENSKIILIGDLEQIDSPTVNELSSGLTSVVSLFKEFEHSGHIKLIKGERSKLASFAAKVM
jgi:predicted ribonuclease YlaK